MSVVPFDLVLEPGEHTLLISGPNTGGKTVLLKTVGLAILLTQAGCVPPLGPGSAIPIVRRAFVDIGDHQSLAADLSTFSAHVAALERALAASDDRSLVLLDELGAGTDPAEGAALAAAVLAAFTDRGTLTVATTHLGALKTLAGEMPGVVNGALHFDPATLSPSYRFTKGIPGRSYGIAIARRLGLPAAVLDAAEAKVPAAERELDRLLAEVERRREAIDRREDEAERRAAVLLAREERAAAEAAGLAERERALRRDERAARRERAAEARAYLLAARKEVEAILAAAQRASTGAEQRLVRREIDAAIGREAALLDAAAAEAAPSGQSLRAGDHVRIEGGATGELVELRGDGRAIVMVSGIRVVVPAGTLAAVAAPVAPARRAARQYAARDSVVEEAKGEIDLRGMRADEAEAAVMAALDRAVLGDLPRLAIIHGMGTGVLRDVVRGVLAADRRVASFEFAPRQQGGVGVTVAVLS